MWALCSQASTPEFFAEVYSCCGSDSPLSQSTFCLIKLSVKATVTLISRGTLRTAAFDSASRCWQPFQFGAFTGFSANCGVRIYVATRVRSEKLVIKSVACVCSCWWMWMFSRGAVLQGFTSYASRWLALFRWHFTSRLHSSSQFLVQWWFANEITNLMCKYS